MNWKDNGYLLSKLKYNENSSIVEFFTENHGKCSGLIFGATSKKIKNYLEIGNKFHLQYSYKNDGRVGYFKIEIINAQTPQYFDNQKKLLCLSSAFYLVKLLTVELEENKKIFFLLDNFFQILKKEEWIKLYVFWELDLFKFIGYDLELKKIVSIEIVDNQKNFFVKGTNGRKIIPSFLIEKSNLDVSKENLINGLKLVGDFLEKTILRPNNINYPIPRQNFINVLK